MPTSLERNLANRDWLVGKLRAEVIGPDTPEKDRSLVVDIQENLVFRSWEDFRKPKIQSNGEEIIWQDPPTKRYGAAILFPSGITEEQQLAMEIDNSVPTPDVFLDVHVDEEMEKRATEDISKGKLFADDGENFDVNLANAHRPSAMGLSFLADFDKERQGIYVTFEGATYKEVDVQIAKDDDSPSSERKLWFRMPVHPPEGSGLKITLRTEDLLSAPRTRTLWVPNCENRLQMTVVSRPYGTSGDTRKRLLTVSVVNTQIKDAGRTEELCFFQCRFSVSGISDHGWILPYPEAPILTSDPLDEARINRLLYRDKTTYAVGHGCAVKWSKDPIRTGNDLLIHEVETDCLPTYDTPATSADLKDRSGEPIRVSMHKLAGLDSLDNGLSEIERLVSAYRNWIDTIKNIETPTLTIPGVERPFIPPDLRETAEGLIERCEACLHRIESGIAFLREDTEVARNARDAFKLANQAMLISQLRSSRDVRKPHWNSETERLTWDKEITVAEFDPEHSDRGYWRAFQIAFILMSLRGICFDEDVDRTIVDLIWFPTGGGKTEAYLGLSAFTLLFNRLAARQSSGSEIIMRYTLRMLTSQQFQRAAVLFCALESVREQHKELGVTPFRLGMWVGGDATPNTRSKAVNKLKKLQRDPEQAENPFVILKCPWCNAQFGPVSDEQVEENRGRRRARSQASPRSVFGYRERSIRGSRASTVVFQCDDPRCDFSKNDRTLPITVIDEDIYEDPPSMLICTVDKFAMLAWKPEIRCIFGIGNDGCRSGQPPTLIIQDELHLISGPLGSIVGAYETAIEELCSDKSGSRCKKPKIVASTATVSQASDQIRALYARRDAQLFPPSGLEAGDSFFARYTRSPDGIPLPGRLYAGVLAPAHGSMQTTEARVFATLLQYPAVMPVVNEAGADRDPWWTLVCFFNSLRELGGAATLFVADARDYLRVIVDRHALGYQNIRKLWNVEELTSRVRSDQIPRAIQRLEVPYGTGRRNQSEGAIEACLASNIIEVGIDIDRLSLMAVVGQPKTTAQYIQVSGRVGRSQVAPGLIVTLYSQSKPRDRSHYERFQSYHQRLYAQVEPTSVTPFSPPAVDRTLHAIIVAAVRQKGQSTQASYPRPYPLSVNSKLRKAITDMISQRVHAVDPLESGYVEKKMIQRLSEWEAWDPTQYGGFGAPPENPPLMHPAGTEAPLTWWGHSWPVLTSLRHVDATCEAVITSDYNRPDTDRGAI